jgi:adenylate kinase family enzyme
MDKQAQFITSHLERVVVIGTSCSGKTTLARTLATIWKVPHIELDALHWQPNWSPRPTAALKQLTQAVVAAEQWVLDGNYGKVRDIVWGRATTLIWLNYPLHVVFGRAMSRTVKRVLFQEQLYAGNRETFRLAFLSKDSILWWSSPRITGGGVSTQPYSNSLNMPICRWLSCIHRRRPPNLWPI